MPFLCPICGGSITEQSASAHLPRFFRCPHCTGFVTDTVSETSYSETYFSEEPEQERRGLFSPLLDFFLWLRMRTIMQALRGKEGRILDYGCGNGKLVAYLRARGFEVEGYDPEPAAVSLAHRRGLPVFERIPEKTYDLIMFWHSLEHTKTPLEDVRALAPRVKSGGKLLIAVPHAESLEARLFGESWFCFDWPFHVVHFTPRALRCLLTEAGYRVERTNYLNLEYTVSSLAQSFLNLFLPKNALYSFVSARRQTVGKGKLVLIGLSSLAALILFSPLLFLFFFIALATRKTAAFIIVAKRV